MCFQKGSSHKSRVRLAGLESLEGDHHFDRMPTKLDPSLPTPLSSLCFLFALRLCPSPILSFFLFLSLFLSLPLAVSLSLSFSLSCVTCAMRSDVSVTQTVGMSSLAFYYRHTRTHAHTCTHTPHARAHMHTHTHTHTHEHRVPWDVLLLFKVVLRKNINYTSSASIQQCIPSSLLSLRYLSSSLFLRISTIPPFFFPLPSHLVLSSLFPSCSTFLNLMFYAQNSFIVV